MTWSLVLTSGAGTSFSGPIASTISATYRRVSASSSRRDIFGGAHADTPCPAHAGEDLAPPPVHEHRSRDDDLALGVGQDFPDPRVEFEESRRAVQLLQH